MLLLFLNVQYEVTVCMLGQISPFPSGIRLLGEIDFHSYEHDTNMEKSKAPSEILLNCTLIDWTCSIPCQILKIHFTHVYFFCNFFRLSCVHHCKLEVTSSFNKILLIKKWLVVLSRPGWVRDSTPHCNSRPTKQGIL